MVSETARMSKNPVWDLPSKMFVLWVVEGLAQGHTTSRLNSGLCLIPNKLLTITPLVSLWPPAFLSWPGCGVNGLPPPQGHGTQGGLRSWGQDVAPLTVGQWAGLQDKFLYNYRVYLCSKSWSPFHRCRWGSDSRIPELTKCYNLWRSPEELVSRKLTERSWEAPDWSSLPTRESVIYI